MAVIEGHAEHVMDAVAPDLLPSLPKLREALDRRRKSQSGLSRLLARLLGLELKLRQYEQGKYFCDTIVRAAGTAALTPVFCEPEALPTLPSSATPAGWLRRVGLQRAASALERVAPRGPTGSRSSAYRCQWSSTPRSGCEPRSSKRSPEPITRSLTVLDTSTSRGPAASITRAAMWTAIPVTSSGRISHSPVCTPARTSIPSDSTHLFHDLARRSSTARAGPSKVARKPSPRS